MVRSRSTKELPTGSLTSQPEGRDSTRVIEVCSTLARVESWMSNSATANVAKVVFAPKLVTLKNKRESNNAPQRTVKECVKALEDSSYWWLGVATWWRWWFLEGFSVAFTAFPPFFVGFEELGKLTIAVAEPESLLTDTVMIESISSVPK